MEESLGERSAVSDESGKHSTRWSSTRVPKDFDTPVFFTTNNEERFVNPSGDCLNSIAARHYLFSLNMLLKNADLERHILRSFSPMPRPILTRGCGTRGFMR
jgi:hypothetical protein